MQRVVSINLNGNVYQLEENGYTALFAYLDAFETRLKDSPERAQLIAEVERLIAEKCQACLAPHKTLITSAEVARIISEMDPVPGPPSAGQPAAEQPAAAAASPAEGASGAGAGKDAGTAPGTGTGTDDKTPTGGHQFKRLWQIREGGMIGGVCLGLATFFNIDVTLVRIVFALFALVTGGWGILAYLGLMFILPRATNAAEAAIPSSATQWPWDNGWPWDKHGWPWDRPDWPYTSDARRDWRAQQLHREQRRAWRDERHATRTAYGPPPSLFGTLIIIFFVMLAFGWLGFWMRGAFFGWPVFWGGPFYWGAPHWVGIVLFFMLFRFLMVPSRGSGWYGHSGYRYRPYTPWLGLWHGMVWLGTVLFIIWLASFFVPGVHEFILQFQTSWPRGPFNV